jgi:hypothetical protein
MVTMLLASLAVVYVRDPTASATCWVFERHLA